MDRSGILLGVAQAPPERGCSSLETSPARPWPVSGSLVVWWWRPGHGAAIRAAVAVIPCRYGLLIGLMGTLCPRGRSGVCEGSVSRWL